jgi:hypothetical protein
MFQIKRLPTELKPLEILFDYVLEHSSDLLMIVVLGENSHINFHFRPARDIEIIF